MARFLQRDVLRFVKAFERATGKKATAAKLNADYEITVFVGTPADDANKTNELDNWMEAHARAAEGH
jgi:hypothetical protein